MSHMPQPSSNEEVPELLTITQIEERHNVTRQTVHNLRRRGVFPKPVAIPGSTRLRWNAAEVAAYFEANPKRPGKKIEKRLKRPEQPPTDH